jgi:hypothetical protein
MKKRGFIGLSLCFLFGILQAQDCNMAYHPMKEGTKITLSSYNEKGKLTSTSETLLKSVSTEGSTLQATFEATIKNDKGKVLSEGKNYKVKCENGTIKMDISSMYMADFANQMKEMEVSISGEGIDIPANLSEGQSLSNGNTEVKLGTGGMTIMTMKFDITNRKVEKKEAKTTPAGTFDCYKISYDIDMKMIFKKNIHAVQWYAPGVGLVRSESYNKKGEMEAYTELTKFN